MSFNLLSKLKVNLFSNSFIDFVLFHLVLSVLFQNIFFWFEISLNSASLWIPLLIWPFIDRYFFSKENQLRRILINYGSYAVLLIVLFLYFSQFIEFTFDGNFYHGDTMIQLVYGWNPIKLTDLYFESNGIIWGQLYPKFTWIFGALLIQVTEHSSAGMIINGLVAVVTFLKANQYLSKKLHKFLTSIVALMIVLNPIFLEQIHTIYVDGLIGLLVSLLIIVNLELIEEFNQKSLFEMTLITIILINIKFTSFAFAGLIDLSAFLFYLIKDRKKALIIFYAGAIILGLGLFIGYSPYLVNLLEGRHIFWPLAGEGNWITGDDQITEVMVNMRSIERFIYSITYGLYEKSLWDFESKGYLFYDQRLGAMGVHFAKYLFTAGLLIPFYFIKEVKRLKIEYVILFGLFAISVMFNYKMVWKLRYVSHFWLMAPLAVLLANKLFKNKVLVVLLIGLYVHQMSDMIVYNYEHNFWATNLYKDIYAQYDDGIAYKVRAGDTDFFAVMEEYKLKQYGVNVSEMVFESLPGEACHRVDMYTICFTK